MGNYIKKYPTETEWLSEQPSFRFPHVSYVVDINYVDFGPYEYPTAIPTDDVLTAASNPQVYAILNDNNIPHTGENDGYTADDLAAITVEQLYDQYSNSIFNDSDIETFNEFVYFTLSFVPNGIFNGCTSLTSVVIPQSATYINNFAFRGCSSLVSITMDDNIETIRDYAFLGCSSLSHIDLPSSLWGIGYYAFASTALTSISIPSSVTRIDNGAFNNCTSLTRIDISDLEAWCNITFSDYGNGVVNPLYYARHLYVNGTEITDLVIPSSVTAIKDYTFMGGLFNSVTIHNSVTSIGNGSFYWCANLQNVTVPSSVTAIGYNAFYYCTSLVSIALPSSLTSISSGTFTYCTSLNSITLPSSLTAIGEGAFYGCTALATLTIPNTVTNIYNYAFQSCSGLTSITLSSSLTEIASSVFSGCTSLTEMTIPNSVTAIGESAFLACSSLERVVIGLSVTSIGQQSFQSCSSLEEIYSLPTTAPSITDSTFSDIKRNGELKVHTGSDYSSWMSELSRYDWEIIYVN